MTDEHYKFPPIQTPVYTDDGRRLHRFRTTSLKNLDICAERARRVMTGTMPETPSDSLAIGSAVHMGHEIALLDKMVDGEVAPVSHALFAAHEYFSEAIQEPGFTWHKTTERSARKYIDDCISAFYEVIEPLVHPLGVEEPFGPLNLYQDDLRVVEVVGTIDCVASDHIVWDWKTGLGKKWERWEHQRWDMQPTVYTWATFVTKGWVPTFKFVVYEKIRGVVTPRVIEMERHEGDWNWLIEKVLAMVTLIERDTETAWPKNDNTALCSPKWCGAWSTCKGRHYSDKWPEAHEPAAHLDH